MPLILAVDRDRRQVNQLVALVHKRLNAELVQASSAAEGLEALAGRVPDLILTSSLISPKEDGVLAGHLRELGPLASHVQTLTIPVLKSSRPRRSKSGVLSKLRRDNAKTASTIEGCDPEVFAEEISLYLARAAEEQQMKAAQQQAKASATAETVEAPASFESLQQFETDEPPAIDDVTAHVDAVEHVDAINTFEHNDEDLSTIASDSSSVDSSGEPPAIDEPRVTSLDLAYDKAISAAEAFGHTGTEADLSVPELETIDAPSMLAESAATSVETAFENFEEAALELSEPVIEEAEAVATADALATVEESETEPASTIPIDRLVALFADLEPRSIEVMEQPAAAESMEAADDAAPIFAEAMTEELTAVSEPEELPEPVAVVVAESPHASSTESPISESPVEPVLDEEALVLLGEAAWKATFRAGLMKDLGLSPEGKKPSTTASRQADGRKSEPSPKVEAVPPAEEPSEETTAAPLAPDTARKENRSKKKKDPRGKSKTPVQDEWGLFDPDQCGFSALVEKLDKVTEEPEEQQPRSGTRVRVIAYSDSLPRS